MGELTSYLKNHKSGGLMFMRNFVVLSVSTLMSDKIKDFNWSKYILDRLVASKMYWDEHLTRYFLRSLLLLMILYVDRFLIEEVRSQREIPILKGWTTNILSTRENWNSLKGEW